MSLRAFNEDAIDLAISYEGKIRLTYPEHGYGAPIERVARPTEWNDAYDGVICDTEDGVRNFLLAKIVGSVEVKHDV